MKSVQIQKAFLLSYDSLYQEGLDPAIALKDVPQRAALEFISYCLHLFNIRKRNDNEFQSRHLMQWIMKMESDDQIRLVSFLQHQSKLIFTPSFVLLSRRPCLDLIQ